MSQQKPNPTSTTEVPRGPFTFTTPARGTRDAATGGATGATPVPIATPAEGPAASRGRCRSYGNGDTTSTPAEFQRVHDIISGIIGEHDFEPEAPLDHYPLIFSGDPKRVMVITAPVAAAMGCYPFLPPDSQFFEPAAALNDACHVVLDRQWATALVIHMMALRRAVGAVLKINIPQRVTHDLARRMQAMVKSFTSGDARPQILAYPHMDESNNPFLQPRSALDMVIFVMKASRRCANTKKWLQDVTDSGNTVRGGLDGHEAFYYGRFELAIPSLEWACDSDAVFIAGRGKKGPGKLPFLDVVRRDAQGFTRYELGDD